VRAHPYRESWAEPENGDHADAVEVYNTSPRHDNKTDRAVAFAKRYRLPMTAGSDAHRTEDAALGGVLSAVPIESTGDYVRLLLGSALVPIRGGERP
jgi:predicted metal-dependent phosphoesterase TrpH